MRVCLLTRLVLTLMLATAGGCGGGTATDTGGGGGGDADTAGGDVAAGDPQGGDSVPSGVPQVAITRPNDGEFLLLSGGAAPQRNLQGDVRDDTAILAQNVQWTVTLPDASVRTGQGTIAGAGTSLQTSWAFTFDQLGDYGVELAYDDGANVATDAISLHVVDNLPPQVTLLQPPDNNGDGIADTRVVEGDLMTLRGRVAELDADTVDPAQMVWSVTAPNGTPTSGTGTTGCNGASTSCTSSFAYTFATPGSYELRLEYTDGQGGVHSATLRADVVANTPPSCQIATPADGSAAAGNATLAVNAILSDPDQPANSLTVAWYIDDTAGAQVGTGTIDRINLNFSGAAPCEAHQLICLVTDDRGATGQASVGFIINSPPTISVTAVTDNTGANVLASAGAFFDIAASTAPILVGLDVNDVEDAQGAGLDMTVTVFDSHTGAPIEVPALVNPAAGTAYTASWGVTATEIGRHTLVARVSDSCGTTSDASEEVIVAPAEPTILPVPGTNAWDVRALLALDGSLYVAFRDGADNLAFVSGLSLDPPSAPTVTDLSALLGALAGGTRPRALARLGDSLVVGTDDGLIVCPMTDPTGGDYSLAVADPANPVECTLVSQYRDAAGDRIGDPQTRALLALPDGSLIAGTDASAVWIAAAPDGPGVECLAGQTILDLTYEPITGAVFGGTDGDYAFRWNPLFGTCDTVTYNANNSGLAAADNVIPAVAADATGVWFGSDRPRLAHLTVADDGWTLHSPTNAPAFLIPGDPIEDIAVESQLLGSPAAARDIVWVGLDPNAATNPSVLRRDEILPSWTRFTAAQDGLPDPRVRRIAVDSAGVKWLATPAGLAAYAWP